MKPIEVREKSPRKAGLQIHPSELQERLLRAMSEAGGPLPSSELAKKLGIEARQVRGYCDWLLRNNYMSQTRRKVRRVVAGVTGSIPIAYWSLEAKGVKFLGTKRTPGNSEALTSLKKQ